MEISEAFEELANEMKKILRDRIEQYGTNPRTGTNTLKGSELEKSIEILPFKNGVKLTINSYWMFVARGWERTGNYNGTFVQFVNNVNDWVRRKGIRMGNMTQTQIVWAVVMNIWHYGIKARPFMVYDDSGDLTVMLPTLEDYIDKWLDRLFEAIINDLDNNFNQ